MANTSKTDRNESKNNARIAQMTPMMAALSSNTDRWITLRASEAMWRELDANVVGNGR